MKKNHLIALLTVIMLLTLITAFVYTDVYIVALSTSLSIVSGAVCSSELLKSQKS